MTSDTLHQFSRQLATWAEAAIARGRSPFRRAELYPPLLTSEGEEAPPLVVWINRDSFMAGGVLLVPPREAGEALAAGVRCAEALGLRHFATWGAQAIVVWEKTAEEPRRLRVHPLASGAEDPHTFRSALHALLEEFKLLSVIGAVPPRELSPYYFANLARATMETAFPPLAQAVRIAQGEGRLCRGQSPHRLARHKTALTLLRLLGLLAGDHLPPAIHPEGLERAMTFALDALPLPLRALLLPDGEEIPLPSEAAVRFHHLFRRLGQVQFGNDAERAARVLEILLAHEGHRLGGHPLPEGADLREALLVNPDRLVPEAAAEVAPPPLLALTALIRQMKGAPPPRAQAESCFVLDREQTAGDIVGTLADRTLPPAHERLELTTRLRSSWPNRRFHLPPRTPRWVWDLLHLLGLAGEGARLDLNLPGGWFGADFAPALLDLIREQFTAERLTRDEKGVRIALRRTVEPEALTFLGGPAGERTLPWRYLREGHRALLPLALNLPAPLFPLLADGAFQPVRPEAWPRWEREIFLFSRSSLGRLLWDLAGGGSLPSRELLPEKAPERGWPVPSPEILDNLRLIPWEGSEPPSSALIDRELALWLGLPAELPLPAPEAPPCGAGGSRTGRRAPPVEEIARAVFSDGIPRFPEQYLYDYYRPDLQRFTFQGPLRPEESFFGQIILRDSAGAPLTVEGEETARALELASYSGRVPVELPRDRRLTAALLDRYLGDLRTLRQALLRQTHLHQADHRAAEALAQRIWKSRPLPPWTLLEE